MKLKLTCADFAFPLLPHDRVLDLVAMLEFDGVDIGLFEGRSHLQPSRVFKNPAKTGAALGRKLANRRLHCADVFLQTDPSFVRHAVNHPQAARRQFARDWFLKALDYAAAAGAKHVTALPGVYFGNEKHAASWERCCLELAWRVAQADERGLVFSVEAHIGSIVPNPKEALRLVRAVPGLTLTLDYTHFTRCGVPDSATEPLIAHASHFHARGARKGRLQTSIQNNTIDYARVLRAMRQSGYSGCVGVEYVWTDWEHCNEVDNLSETIQLRNLLRAQMQRLAESAPNLNQKNSRLRSGS